MSRFPFGRSDAPPLFFRDAGRPTRRPVNTTPPLNPPVIPARKAEFLRHDRAQEALTGPYRGLKQRCGVHRQVRIDGSVEVLFPRDAGRIVAFGDETIDVWFVGRGVYRLLHSQVRVDT